MPRVAITGASGQLGRQVATAAASRGHDVLALSHQDWDITRGETYEELARFGPDVVVNSAAWTDVDACAKMPTLALQINGAAAGAVAAAAARCGARVIQISTNEVFDGKLERPYGESDTPRPINAYGASKLAGERAVAEANSRHVIVRTAWLFGPGGTNFVTKILAAAKVADQARNPLRVVADEWGNPTWTPTLASAIVSLAEADSPPTIVHLAGSPPCTRFDWACAILEAAGRSTEIVPIGRNEYARASTPPARAVLAVELAERLGLPPIGWQEALRVYVPQTP